MFQQKVAFSQDFFHNSLEFCSISRYYSFLKRVQSLDISDITGISSETDTHHIAPETTVSTVSVFKVPI